MNEKLIETQSFVSQLKAIRVYAMVVIIAFIFDFITKKVVMLNMDLYQTIPVIEGLFHLTFVRNTGAAFSLLANIDAAWKMIFLIGNNALVFLFITGFVFVKRNKLRLLQLPLGLISGGGLGNMYDRIVYGSVVDFLEFSYHGHSFPVFNIADICANIGTGWIILILITTKPHKS